MLEIEERLKNTLQTRWLLNTNFFFLTASTYPIESEVDLLLSHHNMAEYRNSADCLSDALLSFVILNFLNYTPKKSKKKVRKSIGINTK